MCRAEVIGRFATTEEAEYFGEGSLVIDETRNIVNLSIGNQRKLQTDLWGGRVW